MSEISASGVEMAEWLAWWGYVPGTPEAAAAWQDKLELDRHVASMGAYIRPNRGIIGDIQPYKSMIDGTMITSRSKHRAHLRQHGCVEIGNETKYVDHNPPPARIDYKPEIAENLRLAKEGHLKNKMAALGVPDITVKEFENG